MQEGDETNIYDLIQGSCADIAAVGDGRQQKVNAVESNEGCGYCGTRGHKERDCRKKKADGRTGRFQGDCNYCHKPGHREAECRKKKFDANSASPAAPDLATLAGPTV